MTRGPDEADQQDPKGGGAAERLREFLAARFGHKAPPIPPDEPAADEELPDEATPEVPPDATGAPPSRPSP